MMLADGDYLMIVAGMGLVTYLPRWLPLQLLAGRRLRPVLESWLDLIPAAILSALVMPAILIGGEPGQLDVTRVELWVAVPTVAVAVLTRSMGGTVVFGMLLFWLFS